MADDDKHKAKRALSLRAARLAAVQSLYGGFVTKATSCQPLLDAFLVHDSKSGGSGGQKQNPYARISLYPDEFQNQGVPDELRADNDLFRKLVRGVWDKRDSLLAALRDKNPADKSAGYLDNELLLQSILLTAAFEISQDKKRTAYLLNEYVSLISDFYDSGLAGVGNGLLQAYADSL